MKQLSVKDALDIMQSDMKLYDTAEKQAAGEGKLRLSLNLPWDIGEYTVTLEGMSDAQGKRNAVGAYGEHIRSIIKERIDDEAITSRAKAAAGRAEQARGEDSAVVGREQRVRQSAVQATANAETDEAHGQSLGSIIGSREALTSRRAEVEHWIRNYEHNLTEARKELRVINAALAAWEDDDAPTDSRETEGGTSEETSPNERASST